MGDLKELTDAQHASNIKDIVKQLNEAATHAAESGLSLDFNVRAVSTLSISNQHSVDVWLMSVEIRKQL